LVGTPEGKKLLGRAWCVLESNIGMNLKETGCRVVDWIHVAQYTVQWRGFVNMVINLRVP